MKVNIKKGDYIVTDEQTIEFVHFCVDKFIAAGCGAGEGTLYAAVKKFDSDPWAMGWDEDDKIFYGYISPEGAGGVYGFQTDITQEMLSWYQNHQAEEVQEEISSKLSLDEFDKRLKELLTQAGKSGYWIDSIGTGYIESTDDAGKSEFIFQNCKYEVNS